MQSAVVYRYTDRARDLLLACAEHRTTDGLWITGAPHVVMPSRSHGEFLGTIIVHLLEHSGDIDRPESWQSLETPILHLVGVRSWNDFARRATCCTVQRTDCLTIEPSIRSSDLNYTPEPELAVLLPLDCASKDIGIAVLRVLATPQG